MTLKEQLTKDIIQAMKTKNKTKKAVLTVIKSNLQNEEIKLKRDLTKDDELTILNRERKQIKDSIDAYSEAGRTDLVEAEEAKLAIVESYLPQQLKEEDIIKILDAMDITKDTAKGPLIGKINKDYKGQVEGKVVSKVVMEYLAKL